MHEKGYVMSNWMTLNESAIPSQAVAEATTGINNLTQINIYNNEYYGDGDYEWEPIGGGHE